MKLYYIAWWILVIRVALEYLGLAFITYKYYNQPTLAMGLVCLGIATIFLFWR